MISLRVIFYQPLLHGKSAYVDTWPFKLYFFFYMPLLPDIGQIMDQPEQIFVNTSDPHGNSGPSITGYYTAFFYHSSGLVTVNTYNLPNAVITLHDNIGIVIDRTKSQRPVQAVTFLLPYLGTYVISVETTSQNGEGIVIHDDEIYSN